MSFFEVLLLFILVAGAAGAVAYYMERRSRRTFTRITPYTQGLRAVLDGDTAHAIQRLREAVSADTSNIDAYIRLGSLFAETGDMARAVKIHRSLTLRADLTNKQKLAVYRALAHDYLIGKDHPRALEALSQILNFSKRDAWALETKTELLSKQGDWNGAIEAAKHLNGTGDAASNRRLAILMTMNGLRLCREGKERDGRIQFREAIKHDFSFVAPYLYWGDSYIREDRVEDAVKIWKRLLEVNSDQSYLVFIRLETHLFDLGKFSEIEQIYRKVTRDHPQNVDAYAALARFLGKRGDVADAIRVLHDGLVHNPDSLWLRRRLIKRYTEVSDTERVIEIAREILDRVMHDDYDFRCSNCGFHSKDPLWQCPECKRLDSFNV